MTARPLRRSAALLCTTLLLCGFASIGPLSAVHAQSPEFELRVGDATAPVDGTVTVPVTYSTTTLFGVEAWSFGVEHDPTGLTLLNVGTGFALFALPLDFHEVEFWDNGWTVSAVVSFAGTSTLPPGLDQELYVASYENNTPCQSGTTISISDSLGVPPVATALLLAGGSSVVPTKVAGSVTPSGIDFNYIAPLLAVAPGESTTATFTISEGSGASNTQGFSMGVEHDPALFSIVGDLEAAGPVAALFGGTGPCFFGAEVLANGWTVGIVYTFGSTTLQFPNPGDAVISVQYENIGGTLGDSAALSWSDSLGFPPVANVVVVLGASRPTCRHDGELLLAVSGFVRGDANLDTVVDIADAVAALSYLFLAGTTLSCLDAADVNDDGSLDLSDPITLLTALFATPSTPLPAPYPNCGVDPTADSIGCATPVVCP